MKQEMIDQKDWTKVAEVELVYKTKIKPSERPLITSSQDIYKVLMSIWDKNKIEFQEEFKVLMLNRSNRILGIYPVSSGGITSTVADPRLIIVSALKAMAVSLVLSHNHPSGSIRPSKADEELTSKISEACRYHDIRVIDHLIVSNEEYFSFADEGFL
ncbi:JAB domain-containing protein [Ferruginibacter sp.]